MHDQSRAKVGAKVGLILLFYTRIQHVYEHKVRGTFLLFTNLDKFKL